MTSTIKTTTAEDTHSPRLVSRSLTPSRTKTKIRHHPNVCCFAWSCRLVPSLLLPGQANLRCSSSIVSTRTCFLLLYLYPSNCLILCCSPHRSLYHDFSLLLCNISWLCLCFCSLEWEFVLFVHLCCVFLENGCKVSRSVEINWKDVHSGRCYLLIHFVTDKGELRS